MANDLFPREVTSNVPRLTLTGCEQLHIEQHRGVVAYSPEEIVFRTASGLLRATGEHMTFARYSAGEALVQGQISSVAYLAQEGRR